MAQFRGKRLFAGRLFAGQLFGAEPELESDDTEDPASPFTARRRSWRPLPVDQQLPPPKRKRKRRQADILFLGH